MNPRDFESYLQLDIPGLEEFVAQWPRNHQFRIHLGLAYLEAGRHREALTSFEQALALNQADAMAKVYLGVSMYELGWYERALAQLKAAAPEDVHHRGKACYWLGATYLKLRAFQEAADALLESLRASPQCVGPHLLLADLSVNPRVQMPRPSNFQSPRYDIALSFRSFRDTMQCRVRLFEVAGGGRIALVSQRDGPQGAPPWVTAEEAYCAIFERGLATDDLQYFAHSYAWNLYGTQHLQRVCFSLKRRATRRRRVASLFGMTGAGALKPAHWTAKFSPSSAEAFEKLTGFRLEWKVD